MNERAPFAGGDQAYLRDEQYADGSKLDVRTSLHRRFATSPVVFTDFVADLIEWPDGGAVLECGSGTGRFWEARGLPPGLSLTLTDLSPGMVAAATERAAAAGFSDVEGHECDVQALPFPDRTFDVAVANHMLYHVPDPDRALGEIARVLQPDGVLVAATNGYGHMGEINDAIAEVFGSRNERLYEVFGIDSGERRLRDHFTSVVWHAYDNDLLVDDVSAVVAYGLSFPPGEQATVEQERAFGEAVARRFVDGRCRIRTRSGVFVARRRAAVAV